MTIKLQLSASEEDYLRLRNAEEKTLDDEFLLDLIEDLDREYTEEELKEIVKDRHYLVEALKMAYMSGFYSGITAVEKVKFPIEITE